MKEKIVKNLVNLTHGNNNDVIIAAINALGDYICSIEQEAAIDRLLVLCDDYNKDIAVASIISISKLAKFFNEKQ
ncbi:HEAT repeat domain-containing protein [Providencia hangzhouensis]|uniref:HEAT repeat domain-containing protein n=1 Tax=Providencia hangzhouensis TaxID=3031799 RepID=UPI0034DD6E2D